MPANKITARGISDDFLDDVLASVLAAPSKDALKTELEQRIWNMAEMEAVYGEQVVGGRHYKKTGMSQNLVERIHRHPAYKILLDKMAELNRTDLPVEGDLDGSEGYNLSRGIQRLIRASLMASRRMAELLEKDPRLAPSLGPALVKMANELNRLRREQAERDIPPINIVIEVPRLPNIDKSQIFTGKKERHGGEEILR